MTTNFLTLVYVKRKNSTDIKTLCEKFFIIFQWWLLETYTKQIGPNKICNSTENKIRDIKWLRTISIIYNVYVFYFNQLKNN